MLVVPVLYGGNLGRNARRTAVGLWRSAWFEQPRKHANECLGDLVPLIVINTLVIVYELVLG